MPQQQPFMRLLRTFRHGISGYSYERPVEECAKDIRADNDRFEPRQRLRASLSNVLANASGFFSNAPPDVPVEGGV